jgi:hydroxymethylpyrimidine/phosphomethylpyrimidine kinase
MRGRRLPDPTTFRLQPSRILLTIAGHDPSSGAGITADLATFAAHGFFGTSAITALTAQSTLGVLAVKPVEAGDLRLILQHLASDLPPAGIKIGMLGAASIASTVAAFIASDAMAPRIPIVLDPVLRSSSGAELLPPGAVERLHSELLTWVGWVTPNWNELAILAETPKISTLPEAEQAMHHLGRRHPHLHIVATGGDQAHPTDLFRLPSGQVQAFPGDRIESRATHGTGCACSPPWPAGQSRPKQSQQRSTSSEKPSAGLRRLDTARVRWSCSGRSGLPPMQKTRIYLIDRYSIQKVTRFDAVWTCFGHRIALLLG